jgi:hypothetical protein
MWYDWDLHAKKVKHWKSLFFSLYNAIGDKKYRPLNPIHVKIKTAPSTYVEYKIATIEAKNGAADEYIKFNLEGEQTGETINVDIYPAFELKSNSLMVNETVIFEMLKKQLKDNGFIKEVIVTEITTV